MARLKHWILDDQWRPIQVDLLTWAKWFGSMKRVVCQETIAQNRVSTIFLGIDHNFLDRGPPILWETMTFGAKLDGEQDRCAGSKEQAEAMHERMVESVCQEYGIPYNASRTRENDRGVHRRQAAVYRRRMKELDKIFKQPNTSTPRTPKQNEKSPDG